jgi:hypothetical protein
MQYIMVSDQAGHWDKLPAHKSHFEPAKLVPPMPKEKIRENTTTVFVKLSRKTKMPEKAWRGRVHGFEYIDDKLYFIVTLTGEVKVPDRYECMIKGWYAVEYV